MTKWTFKYIAQSLSRLLLKQSPTRKLGIFLTPVIVNGRKYHLKVVNWR